MLSDLLPILRIKLMLFSIACREHSSTREFSDSIMNNTSFQGQMGARTRRRNSSLLSTGFGEVCVIPQLCHTLAQITNAPYLLFS